MSHAEQSSKSSVAIPFIMVFLAVAFLIMVSDLNTKEKTAPEVKTEAPAH